MPNTLAHLGVQGLLTRGLVAGADIKWVYLACVLPDVPWIANRILIQLLPTPWLYDLRLYSIVQCSLLFSLVLAGGLAAFSTQRARVFAILSLGVGLHLGLDALQTKWANGVHLFAPFSWELINFGLFWPEAVPSQLLTGLGLAFFVYAAWRLPHRAEDLVWPSGRVAAGAALLLTAYAAAPLLLLEGPERSDSHSVGVLRAENARAGRPVEFDRRPYGRDGDGLFLTTFAGERLALEDTDADPIGNVSVRGHFLDPHTVRVDALRVHPPLARDLASYVGLSLVGLTWGRALFSLRRRETSAP